MNNVIWKMTFPSHHSDRNDVKEESFSKCPIEESTRNDMSFQTLSDSRSVVCVVCLILHQRYDAVHFWSRKTSRFM